MLPVLPVFISLLVRGAILSALARPMAMRIALRMVPGPGGGLREVPLRGRG